MPFTGIYNIIKLSLRKLVRPLNGSGGKVAFQIIVSKAGGGVAVGVVPLVVQPGVYMLFKAAIQKLALSEVPPGSCKVNRTALRAA